MQLRYDEEYAVEMFDRIEVEIGGGVFDGVVTKLHPRKGDVSVRYDDHINTLRNGDPRRCAARVPLSAVVFMGRDE